MNGRPRHFHEPRHRHEPRRPPQPRHPARLRGAAMLEALAASTVLAIGLLALAGLQGIVRAGIRTEGERVHQLQAARAALEAWRASPVAEVAPGATQSIRRTVDRPSGDATVRTMQLDASLHGDATATRLAWTDVTVEPAEGARTMPRVLLHSAHARSPAALSGALLVQRTHEAPRPLARAAAMPLDARDLRDGRSLWRPAASSALAFVVDNATARVVARCSDADDAASCTPVDALLLSGWIRVSRAAPPDPAPAGEPALAAAVALSLTRGTLLDPGCLTDARDGALAYHCVIAPENGAWSGRSDVVPSGWVLGPAADQHRVCRYVAPAGSLPGAPRNIDHPARYELVDRPLMQQNFLVIRGDQACPAAPPSADHPDGIATLAHQP